MKKNKKLSSGQRTAQKPAPKTSVSTHKTPNRNPFAGASDVYLTPNKIAVTTTITSSAKRGYTKTTKTKYYKQNDTNLRKLKAAIGGTVRIGRTGNRYKNL